MPYSHITRAAFRTQLRTRLDDPSGIHWLDAELNTIVSETLRTWAANTGFWRERMAFNTVINTPFYDLPTNLPTLLSYNTTDLELVTAIQYHLIEPAGVPWTGTAMFTLADVVSALERRRNQFLLETGAVITRISPVAVPPPPIGLVPIVDTVIDVRRVAWRNAAGNPTPLVRGDEWNFNAFLPGWSVNPDTPSGFSVLAPPPLTIQLAPVPLDVGTLDLLTVSTGATLDPTVPTLLGIPDNFAWVIKWGALSDLLGKAGPAFDLGRASYSQMRWQEGVELARIFPSVVQAAINGVPVVPQSVADLDAYNPLWQQVTGAPNTVGIAGWNLIALSKVPDVGPYSILLDVVRNAPLPAADGNFLQVGREDLDALLDYAQHLCSFKMGGAEFQATLPLLERFKRHVAISVERLPAVATYLRALQGQTTKETKQRPRRESDVMAAV